MPYNITRANGTNLTVITDGAVDSTYSVTFIGKSYPNFGQAINNNFLRLLENSAKSSQPTTSVTGQLWYDTSAERLKYYDGTSYKILTPLPNNSSGYLKNNGTGTLTWEPSISLAQLKTTVAASADFAAFKTAIAALS